MSRRRRQSHIELWPRSLAHLARDLYAALRPTPAPERPDPWQPVTLDDPATWDELRLPWVSVVEAAEIPRLVAEWRFSGTFAAVICQLMARLEWEDDE